MTDLNKAGPCDCIEKTNEFLSAHNAKIMQAICFGKSDMGGLSPPLIELEKLDAKKASETAADGCLVLPVLWQKISQGPTP